MEAQIGHEGRSESRLGKRRISQGAFNIPGPIHPCSIPQRHMGQNNGRTRKYVAFTGCKRKGRFLTIYNEGFGYADVTVL